jgi:(p)ppGpp synthase/HD superfamily hydrolase
MREVRDYSQENKGSFFDRLEGQVLPSELVKIKTAYMIAKHAHRAQMRKEEDAGGHKIRYFEHVRRVALILLDTAGGIGGDRDIPHWRWQDICAALLHDTIEDTEDVTAEILEELFGEEVCRIVMSMTKWPGKKDNYVYQIYKGGERVIFLKMCDRLDNLRSLDRPEIPESFREKQLKETREVWLPGPFSHFRHNSVYQEIADLCEYEKYLTDFEGSDSMRVKVG